MKNLDRFEGQLDLRILPPPHKRKWWERLFPHQPRAIVLNLFTYIDKDGVRWEAPAGTRINGLSSPWCLWRLMPPFAWRAIRPSAIHDAGCTYCTRPSWAVHKAMKCENAGPARAWITWFLIRAFGPRFPGNSARGQI